jgi:type I restriction enzyme R subunit
VGGKQNKRKRERKTGRVKPMPTNTKESGLEDLIINSLVKDNGYEQGTNEDYNRDYAVDEKRLFHFLTTTQKEEMSTIGLFSKDSGEAYELNKQKFFDFLKEEITKRGVIDVLRNGIKYYPVTLALFYQTPSERNEQAKKCVFRKKMNNKCDIHEHQIRNA